MKSKKSGVKTAKRIAENNIILKKYQLWDIQSKNLNIRD
jgi:hypothetical protein